MTLWWIGNLALFAVFLVVVYLLHGVLSAACLPVAPLGPSKWVVGSG